MTGSAGWHATVALDDVWDGEMLAVDVDGTEILLVHLDGELHAYDNQCPHARSPLSDGDLSDGVVTCPSHLWTFDAASGEGLNPKGCTLTRFPVRVVDGVVHVRVGVPAAG